MSLLDAYSGLMESVTWKQRSSIDQYGDPTYTEYSISVIWYDDQRIIRDQKGEELQQYAYIQTKEAIQEGDIIVRDSYPWPIIGIQKTPTFSGEQFRIGNLGMRMI